MTVDQVPSVGSNIGSKICAVQDDKARRRRKRVLFPPFAFALGSGSGQTRVVVRLCGSVLPFCPSDWTPFDFFLLQGMNRRFLEPGSPIRASSLHTYDEAEMRRERRRVEKTYS